MNTFLAKKVLQRSTSNGRTIMGTSTPAQLIQDNQRLWSGLGNNVRCFL